MCLIALSARRVLRTGLQLPFRMSAVIPSSLRVLPFLSCFRAILILYSPKSRISSVYCRVYLTLRSLSSTCIAVHRTFRFPPAAQVERRPYLHLFSALPIGFVQQFCRKKLKSPCWALSPQEH